MSTLRDSLRLPIFIDSYLQYQNAPKLNKLLNELEQVLIIPVDLFYMNFYNIQTCDTQGLNNWGKILNITRNFIYYDYQQVFGFDTGVPNPTTTDYPQNFGHGSFFSETTRTKKGVMSDEQYRIVILLTYQRYSVDCSVKACTAVSNFYVQKIYHNTAYDCEILEDFTAPKFTYNFNFTLSAFDLTVCKLNQMLPKPAGIRYDVTWSAR